MSWKSYVVGMAAWTTLLGCQKANTYQAPPPPSVQVALPIRQTVSSYLETTGTTEAVAVVQIRARVRGFVQEVKFEPYTDVQANQVLYLIEPEQYQADVDSRRAAVAAAEVAAQQTKIEFDRQTNLYDQNATPERNLVAAKAEYDAALAALESAQAELARAELNLRYTQVRAPIAGRIGRSLIKQGNLVDGNEATHLADIVNYDQIYANFVISETQFLRIATDRKHDGLRSAPTVKDKKALTVELGREIDSGYPHKGHFDSADLAVDESTGTYRIRAIFDNPEKELVPGLYVRIRIPLATIENALLVPESCLSSDQAGRFLLTVDQANQVERQDVILGARHLFGPDAFVVVQDGLNANDRVVVNGLQRARPGVTVAPEIIQMDDKKEDSLIPQTHVSD